MSSTSSPSVPATTSAKVTKVAVFGPPHIARCSGRISMRYTVIEVEQLTDQEVDDIVKEMGFEKYEPGIPWYIRIKCRIFGPHDWISVMGYDMVTGEMEEEGAICERCHKEAQWSQL